MLEVFKNKKLATLLVLVVLALLVHNRWTVPRVSYDQMRQLVALKNFVNGDEITFSFIDPESEKEVIRNGEFPVGYYFLMAPFTLLSSNILLLHRMVEILGILLLVLQLFQIGKAIGDKFDINYFEYYLLLFSLIQLNPWRASGFTDIWSLYFFISVLRYSIFSELSLKNSAYISFLSFLTVFMRYAYYPLAFVGPLILLFRYRKVSLKSLLPVGFTAFLLISMIYFHDDYFKNQTHIESQFGNERFFWSNLKQIDPIAFNAFFSDHVIMGALNMKRWGLNTNWSMKYLILCIAVLILLILGFGMLRLYRQLQAKRTYNQKNQIDLLSIIIFATGLIVSLNWGSITALSVYYPSKQEDFIYTWSLISRYFAPSYVVLQFLLIYLVLKLSKSKLRTVFAILLIGSGTFQLAYWVSFVSRFSFRDTWTNYEEFYGRDKMNEVISNRKNSFSVPVEHLDYIYIGVYYITDHEMTINGILESDPDYFKNENSE